MKYLAYHENKQRGTFNFPIEYHYVDPTHPRYMMPFHWHMECELILVQCGTLTISMDAATQILEAGSAALIPEGVLHGGTPVDCVYECVVFDFGRFLQGNTIGRQTQGEILSHAIQQPLIFQKDSREEQLIGELTVAMKGERPGYEFATTGLLWQLMGLLVESYAALPHPPVPTRDKRTEALKRALRRIRQDYNEPLTLDALAAEAGMAPKYFCRAFRQITGRTPVDYLNYYRVECACERLCLTDATVTDIALSCGFNDVSYFTRAFRKYKGVSAKKFRSAQSSAPEGTYHD
ncbi:MAG: AraC family transcriptional regulator [Oscillospiraceae bacterium]